MQTPLISPEELIRIAGEVVLLDARQNAADYAAGHLAGAIHADVNRHLSAASDPGFDASRGGRHPLPQLDRFAQQLGDWGIEPDTAVVVYDDQAGANAAARLWWMLRSLGHENVSVLDGGMAAAVAAGTKTSTSEAAPSRVTPYPARGWMRPTVDADAIDEIRRDSDWKILDVRSRERYRGETEPIDPVAGHIPGALNLPFSENLEGGRFKSPEQLRAQYLEFLGNTPVERLAVHCGSGVTACHTLLALEHAGLHGASLYVGSWSEWCRNDRPQAKGD
jgi:thiosulfate/3-mercaptopyruvate sulfurtransferase